MCQVRLGILSLYYCELKHKTVEKTLTHNLQFFKSNNM